MDVTTDRIVTHHRPSRAKRWPPRWLDTTRDGWWNGAIFGWTTAAIFQALVIIAFVFWL